MKRRMLGGYALLAVVSIGMAGCSSDNSGVLPQNEKTTAAAASPTPNSNALPHSGAPKVANPLPASALEGNPCTEALTPEQVERAVGKPVRIQDSEIGAGPQCDWGNTETLGSMSVSYDRKTGQGLSGIYQRTKPNAIF